MKLLAITYLVKIIFKFLMGNENLSGRHFIHFQHDLAIVGPQIFDIIRPLVLFYSPEEPFPVISQRLINVDLTIFWTVPFSNRWQMTGGFSNQILSFLVLYTSSLFSLRRNLTIKRCFTFCVSGSLWAAAMSLSSISTPIRVPISLTI